MKIGEFSKKHNITQDTIRHYIAMGLLVAEKQGFQYKFSEEDSCDLEKIIALKQLDFSLAEIQEILCFYRLEGDKTDEYRDFYLSLLERKKEQAQQEEQKFNSINRHLIDRINELKTEEISRKRSLGFPISSISLLRCPDCRKTLNISGGTLEKNMILEAVIYCECGYRAVIENGIYVDKKTVRTKTVDGKVMPTKKAFLETASPKYINFMYNGTTALIDSIQKYGNEPDYIMELDHCVGRFLMQYLDYLPSGCTYILTCYDKDRITSVKHNLEQQSEHNNFIFFCCEMDQLPLKASFIDIIVDHGMSRAYGKSANKFILDIVSPFLRQGGLLIGAYHNLGPKSMNVINLPLEAEEYCNRNKILEKLSNLDFKPVDVSDIGPVIETSLHAGTDQEVFQTIYAGRKQRDAELVSCP